MRKSVSNLKMLSAMVRMDLRKQYAGSFGGIGWLCIGPLILLAVYTVVYMLIFRVRTPGLTQFEYVLHVFSGLVPFLAFSSALSSSAGSIRTEKALWNEANVTNWIIPAKSVLVSYATLPVGLVITFLGDLFLSDVTVTWLWVGPILVSQIAFSVGLGFLLSVITVVVTDIQFLLQYATIILLVITPIAYTVSMVPERLLPLMSLNPLYHYVTCYQFAILINETPPIGNLLGAFIPGALLLVIGYVSFNRVSGHLSDFI